MKRYAYLVPLALFVMIAAGCGQQDRASLAAQTVRTYWSDAAHGKFKQAYSMITSGQQAVISYTDYEKNMLGFMTGVGSVKAVTGKPTLDGDRAVVPIKLESPKAPDAPLKAYQHLYWENGSWKVSDTNGGLSTKK